MLSNRTYGIELEITGLNTEQAAIILNMAGIEAYAEGYNHSTRSHWKCVTDASIGYANCEVVSPVLRGEDGLAQIRKVCTALEAAGAGVSTACGYHVHFGVNDLNHTQLKNVCKMYVKYEDAMNFILPRSRRGTPTYCRDNSVLFTDVDAAFEAIDACSDFRALSNLLNRSLEGWSGETTRFYKLNLQAFFRHGTIEFRAHSGTVNGEKVCNWIILLDAMISEGANARNIRLPNGRVNELSVVERVKLMCRGFGVNTAVTRFYINRANELNRAV